METYDPSGQETGGTTQSILVASDDGEILEPTAGEDDGDDCECHLLPGDYPCAACYIDGDAEWPDETDESDD